MRRALVNLSLRPFRNDNLYRLIYASCAVVLVLASLSNPYLLGRHGWTLLALRGELRAQRQALSELEERERALGRDLAAADSAMLQKRADFTNTAILRRVFSWTRLFNELEKVVPPDVRLRSVRPVVDARGKVDVVLEGTARNFTHFVELEEALMISESFSRVYPGSERVEGAAYRPGAPPLQIPGAAPAAAPAGASEIAFSLSFEYFPAGRPQAAAGGGTGR